MKFLVRWAFRLFILLVVVVVALVLLKDVLLKAWTEHHIRNQTGMDVTIGRFEVGLFSPTLTMADCRLYNPAAFGGSPFLDMPDLHLECDSRALAERKLRFKLIRLSVREMNVVEDRNGQTNLVVALGLLGHAASGNAVDLPSVLGFRFGGIDTLNLTLGKVRYTSLRRPGKSTEVKLDLKNEILTNVRSVADLNNVVIKTLFRNGITISEAPPRPVKTAEIGRNPPSRNARPPTP